MSSISSYLNRTYDVLAYDGAQSEGDVQLDMVFAQNGESGKICTGIQKLVQRFILELFTERTSMPYLTHRGTDFLYEARTGQIRNQIDLQAALARALVDVKRNLQSEESASDPDDERYGSAEIQSVAYNAGDAVVYIKLTSKASSCTYIFPISVTL